MVLTDMSRESQLYVCVYAFCEFDARRKIAFNMRSLL
jgi:hypothetical protein